MFICLYFPETPPFVPQLSSLDDTSNFEEFEKIKHPVSFEETKGHQFSGKDLPFLGFTFVKKDHARLVVDLTAVL